MKYNRLTISNYKNIEGLFYDHAKQKWTSQRPPIVNNLPFLQIRTVQETPWQYKVRIFIDGVDDGELWIKRDPNEHGWWIDWYRMGFSRATYKRTRPEQFNMENVLIDIHKLSLGIELD